MKQKKRENSYSRDRETLDRDETGGYRYLEKNEKVKNVALLNQALFPSNFKQHQGLLDS